MFKLLNGAVPTMPKKRVKRRTPPSDSSITPTDVEESQASILTPVPDSSQDDHDDNNESDPQDDDEDSVASTGTSSTSRAKKTRLATPLSAITTTNEASQELLRPRHIIEAIEQHRIYPLLQQLVPTGAASSRASSSWTTGPVRLGERIGKGKQCQIFDLAEPRIYMETNDGQTALERDAVVKMYPFFPIVKIGSSPPRTLLEVARHHGVSPKTLQRINSFVPDMRQRLKPGMRLLVPMSKDNLESSATRNFAVYDVKAGRIRCVEHFLLEVLVLSYVKRLLRDRLSPHFLEAFAFYGRPHAGFVVLERVDGSLDQLIQPILAGGPPESMRAMLFQIGHAVLAMQVVHKLVHNDVNLGNVFCVSTDSDSLPQWTSKGNSITSFSARHWHYRLNQLSWHVPNTGQLYKLGDFGFAAKFERPQVIRDDVYEGCFVADYNIAPVFQVGYDIMYLLGCLYFWLFHRWETTTAVEAARRKSCVREFECLVAEMVQKYFPPLDERAFQWWQQMQSERISSRSRPVSDDAERPERDIEIDSWSNDLGSYWSASLDRPDYCHLVTRLFFYKYYQKEILRPLREFTGCISPYHFLGLDYFAPYRTTAEHSDVLQISSLSFDQAHFQVCRTPGRLLVPAPTPTGTPTTAARVPT